MIAAPRDGWDSDPFRLSARNGYLYGRGATDDKGPTLAVACAAAALRKARKLGVDLVCLVEGEEETGSVGFREAVRRHRVRALAFSFVERRVVIVVWWKSYAGLDRADRRDPRQVRVWLACVRCVWVQTWV